jgi:hypothetical protein
MTGHAPRESMPAAATRVPTDHSPTTDKDAAWQAIPKAAT